MSLLKPIELVGIIQISKTSQMKNLWLNQTFASSVYTIDSKKKSGEISNYYQFGWCCKLNEFKTSNWIQWNHSNHSKIKNKKNPSENWILEILFTTHKKKVAQIFAHREERMKTDFMN